jgi:transcriptional regulator with XRE-family HTH domain
MIAGALARARKARGHSLQSLALRVGDITGVRVARGSVLNWERGRTAPPEFIVRALEEILHVELRRQRRDA